MLKLSTKDYIPLMGMELKNCDDPSLAYKQFLNIFNSIYYIYIYIYILYKYHIYYILYIYLSYILYYTYIYIYIYIIYIHIIYQNLKGNKQKEKTSETSNTQETELAYK